ncbi:MAG: NADH-quinone oxidoreductase subunit H [Actinobacteria bacterium]|nr:NADH-quinone oxidoreductase subunit H [Actinomycetota bacterium]
MVLIFKKIVYLLLVIVVNLYVCTYLANKLTAHMELRRGYRVSKAGGISLPFSRFFKYLSNEPGINFWTFMLFVFSFLIWSVSPLSASMVLIDMDSSLMVALLMLLVILTLNVSSHMLTGYNMIMIQSMRKTASVLFFMIPVFLNISGVVLINKTLGFKEIINSQYQYWNVIYQPLGFLTTLLSVLFIFKQFKLNRKSEIEAFSTDSCEGKGLGKAINRFSEYNIIFVLIYMLTVLYLGGYQNLYIVRGEVMLGLKFYLIFVIILIAERSIAKINDYKLIQRINIRYILPLSVVNFIVTLGFFIYRNIFGLI